jgi:hypothetical protein
MQVSQSNNRFLNESGKRTIRPRTDGPQTKGPWDRWSPDKRSLGQMSPDKWSLGPDVPGQKVPGTDGPRTKAPGTDVPGQKVPGTDGPRTNESQSQKLKSAIFRLSISFMKFHQILRIIWINSEHIDTETEETKMYMCLSCPFRTPPSQ